MDIIAMSDLSTKQLALLASLLFKTIFNNFSLYCIVGFSRGQLQMLKYFLRHLISRGGKFATLIYLQKFITHFILLFAKVKSTEIRLVTMLILAPEVVIGKACFSKVYQVYMRFT